MKRHFQSAGIKKGAPELFNYKDLLTLLLSDGLMNVTSSRVSKILFGPLTIRI